jgi:hypothetical protein
VSGAWIPPVELAQRNDSGAEGYRFEPYRAYHSINNLQGYETDGKPQADGLELDRELGWMRRRAALASFPEALCFGCPARDYGEAPAVSRPGLSHA